jgi:hypothetical protein
MATLSLAVAGTATHVAIPAKAGIHLLFLLLSLSPLYNTQYGLRHYTNPGYGKENQYEILAGKTKMNSYRLYGIWDLEILSDSN